MCAAVLSLARVFERVVAAGDPSVDVFSKLAGAGVAGVVLVAVIIGWLVPKPTVVRLEESLRRAEDRRDQLIDVYQREVIPALHEFNRVAAALLPMLQRLVERELGR